MKRTISECFDSGMRLSEVVAGIDAGEVEPTLTEEEIEDRISESSKEAGHQRRRNRSRVRVGPNFPRSKPYVFTRQQVKDAKMRAEAEQVELKSLGREDW